MICATREFRLYAAFIEAPASSYGDLTGLEDMVFPLQRKEFLMTDLIYLGLGVGFFAVMAWYLRLCERA